MRTLLLALALCAAAPVEACTRLAGADAVVETGRTDFVIMGEAHGTAELPAAFAELVCAFARGGGPLTVGLEFLPDAQPALNAYLGSDGGAAARRLLLASPGWSRTDGRSSRAILNLVEALRHIRHSGSDLAVVAFDHPSERPGTSAAREKGMADLLLAARAARPRAPVLALTGIGHAGKSEWTSFGPPFRSLSQHLPSDRTVAITFVSGGGEIWACRAATPEAPAGCGPRRTTSPGEARPRAWSWAKRARALTGQSRSAAPFPLRPPRSPCHDTFARRHAALRSQRYLFIAHAAG